MNRGLPIGPIIGIFPNRQCGRSGMQTRSVWVIIARITFKIGDECRKISFGSRLLNSEVILWKFFVLVKIVFLKCVFFSKVYFSNTLYISYSKNAFIKSYFSDIAIRISLISGPNSWLRRILFDLKL